MRFFRTTNEARTAMRTPAAMAACNGVFIPSGESPVLGSFAGAGVVVVVVVVFVGVGVDVGVGVGSDTAISSFVIVQVLLSPEARVTLPFELQSPLKLCVYMGLASSLIRYVPAERVYDVPGTTIPTAGLPVTSAPESFTCRLKEEAVAVPPLLFTTCLMTCRVAEIGVGGSAVTVTVALQVTVLPPPVAVPV